MIILLSPAKSLDSSPLSSVNTSRPTFQTDANKLVKILKQKDINGLQELMSISEPLATENVKRYQNFRQRPSQETGKTAIDTFVGDVYRGLSVSDFSSTDYAFAQKHIRILSGLYGILKPLDKMQPYRLEMGTKLSNERGKNLYEFWGNKVTNELKKSLSTNIDQTTINLASEEYFKVIKTKLMKSRVLTINFKEYRGDELKFISFTAKVARGMMARYIIKNRLETTEGIKGFNEDGYSFSDTHSTDDHWLFIR